MLLLFEKYLHTFASIKNNIILFMEKDKKSNEPKYPSGYIKVMKKKKRKKLRNVPIESEISEQYYNDALMIL